MTELPENGWLMVTNKLAQRIRELDEALKAEMTERARLAEKVEFLEGQQWVVSKIRELQDRIVMLENTDTKTVDPLP